MIIHYLFILLNLEQFSLSSHFDDVHSDYHLASFMMINRVQSKWDSICSYSSYFTTAHLIFLLICSVAMVIPVFIFLIIS